VCLNQRLLHTQITKEGYEVSFDGFIQLDGIQGESTDDKHRGWIEILSYDWAVRQTVSGTASSVGGASAERADFLSFGFTKLLDQASPLLMVACAAGTHFGNVTIELCRAGTQKVKYMEYRLTDCLINSVVACTGDPRARFPVELVNIYYGKIQWGYTVQSRRGGWAAGNIACGWSLERNCRI
jgi:type VI secretion system secreted protein Hcp